MGVARYEFIQQTRRPTLGILTIGLVIVPVLSVLISHDSFAGYRAALASGSLPLALVQERVMVALVPAVWINAFLVVIMLLPLLSADMIPKDRQAGITDLFGALPVPRFTYLTGKLLGLWTVLWVGTGFAVLLTGLAWTFLVGPLDWAAYLKMWAAIGVLMMSQATLAMFLASGQAGPRQAVIVGAGVGLVSLVGCAAGIVIQMNQAVSLAKGIPFQLGSLDILWHLLNPGHSAVFTYYLFGYISAVPGVVPVEMGQAIKQVMTGEAAGWALLGAGVQTVLAWSMAGIMQKLSLSRKKHD